VLSAEDAMKFWAEKNGCSSGPLVTNILPQVNDGTSVTKKQYTRCNNNAEVVYYIVKGMGHTWPPKSPQVPLASGPSTKNILHSVSLYLLNNFLFPENKNYINNDVNLFLIGK